MLHCCTAPPTKTIISSNCHSTKVFLSIQETSMSRNVLVTVLCFNYLCLHHMPDIVSTQLKLTKLKN
uniref:Uncharacterized protein n=1 Tax=Rhizophora mucronata TaxID=61149 RepID=A0A2P2P8U6_RHIMU